MRQLRMIYLFSKTILLLPLIVSLFILDRLLLCLLIHMESKNLTNWISDKEQIKASIIRVVLIYTMLLLIYLFN
jgi:hypothetical protein